ncbi:MAG: hypothetical protein K2W96_11230 [Gemmataceae bacterium]|nr:hypothetical protein [Gemmataceae bacterium]
MKGEEAWLRCGAATGAGGSSSATGRQHSFPVGEVPENEAVAWLGKIELLHLRLGQGLLSLPDGTGIIEFLKSDGKPREKRPPTEPRRRAATLGDLRDEYLRAHRSSLEPNTVATIQTHFRHLARCLGEKAGVGSIDLAALQGCVRSREGAVQAGTIRMEVVSLRTAWNWGVRFGLAAGAFPGRALRYPKAEE